MSVTVSGRVRGPQSLGTGKVGTVRSSHKTQPVGRDKSEGRVGVFYMRKSYVRKKKILRKREERRLGPVDNT